MAADSTRISEGKPYPLGAHIDRRGTNFSGAHNDGIWPSRVGDSSHKTETPKKIARTFVTGDFQSEREAWPLDSIHMLAGGKVQANTICKTGGETVDYLV